MKNVMRISAFALLFTVVAVNLAMGQTKAKTSPAWATNWSAFVAELSVQVAKDNYFLANVNSTFLGKTVRWSGKVTEIKPPENTDKGLIRLAMKPEKLVMKSGTVVLDSLVLRPEASEWTTWERVSVNDTVTFATVLDGGPFPPQCVLMKMDGMGENAGKVIAWINTKGGSSVKSEPASKRE